MSFISNLKTFPQKKYVFFNSEAIHDKEALILQSIYLREKCIFSSVRKYYIFRLQEAAGIAFKFCTDFSGKIKIAA